MMRLVMEAVMILAIVGGMVFVSKMSASESVGPRVYGDENGEETETKEIE